MNAPNKYKRCDNCINEGDRDANKCDKNITRCNMRESGRHCLYHAFRPGWENQGTLFEEVSK